MNIQLFSIQIVYLYCYQMVIHIYYIRSFIFDIKKTQIKAYGASGFISIL